MASLTDSPTPPSNPYVVHRPPQDPVPPVANPNKAASTQELGARDSHRLWKGFINRDKVAFRGWLSHFISELLKPGKREGPLWTTAVLLCCASYFGACEPGNRSPSLTCNPVSACLALRRIETDTNSASGLEPAVCRAPCYSWGRPGALDRTQPTLLTLTVGSTAYPVLRSSNWVTLAPVRNTAQSFISARRFSSF